MVIDFNVVDKNAELVYQDRHDFVFPKPTSQDPLMQVGGELDLMMKEEDIKRGLLQMATLQLSRIFYPYSDH